MNEEERFDFEKKHEEDLQRLRGFRLLDDDFMSKVFEDKGCVEFLLQIILKRDDLKVTNVSSQYVIKTTYVSFKFCYCSPGSVTFASIKLLLYLALFTPAPLSSL